MVNQKNVEYGLWYTLCGVLFTLVGVTWGISFLVPPGEEQPIKWMTHNKVGLFSFYIILCTTVLALYFAIILGSSSVITLIEPLTFQGIFLFAVTVLLLSSFFTVVEPSASARFYDTHPLIFYTSVGLVVLGLTACIATIVKSHLNHKLEL
jgi:uncharacterized membrane protein YidH (DUF202 family)